MRIFNKPLLNSILHFSCKLSSSISFYELCDNLCTSFIHPKIKVLNQSSLHYISKLCLIVKPQSLIPESPILPDPIPTQSNPVPTLKGAKRGLRGADTKILGNGPEWSPLLVRQKKIQVDSERKDMEQFTIFSKNIIKVEGGVPQKISENKNGPEWSPLLVHQKKIEVDSKGKDMEQFTIFSKNIIKA